MAEEPEDIQAELIPMEAATLNEPTEEAEQPLLTPEEVGANLAAMNSGTAAMEADGDRIVEWDPTERVEKATDETLEIMEEEHPTERVGTSPAEGIATNTTAPESREVVIITDEEERTKKVAPRDEGPKARAATVHIYQRRLAREETSGRRYAEEQSRESPGQRAREDVNITVGPPHRRRRLLIDDEPAEEEEVIFTPVDARPNSGKPDLPAEVEDSERDMRERKRKGYRKMI